MIFSKSVSPLLRVELTLSYDYGEIFTLFITFSLDGDI